MFGIPVFLYAIATLLTKTEIHVSIPHLAIIVFSAVVFSYLGNVFSLKSLEHAPNPGYSLMISKSYVVFTTLVSIFLFNAELTLRKAIAIICIVAFSALVVISKSMNKNEKEHRVWLPLSLGSFFCWGFLALSSKYLLDQGVGILERLVISLSIVSAIILGEIVMKKVQWQNLSKHQLGLLMVIGITQASSNFGMMWGYQIAPNVGYVNAVNAASIAGVAVLASIFFKDELTRRKLLGILGVTVGLLLLLI